MKVNLCVPNAGSSYTWGGMLSQHVGTSVGKDTAGVTLTGDMKSLNTSDYVNSEVSFLHETHHYIQDISTGVGHWDYIHRIAYCDTVAVAFKRSGLFPLRGFESHFAINNSVVREIFANPADVLVVWPDANVSSARVSRISDEILGGRSDQVVQQEMKNLTASAILEQDAALSTFISIISHNGRLGRYSSLGEETDGAWNVFKMDDRYSYILKTTLPILFPFENVAGDELATHLKGSCQFLSWIYDISLSYPSPWLQEQLNLDKGHYEPATRLTRLIRAAYVMPGSDFHPIISALSEGNTDDAERRLLEHCVHPYVHSRLVYQDWQHWMEKLAAHQPFDGAYAYLSSFRDTMATEIPTAKIRANTCMSRLKREGQENFFLSKSNPVVLCSISDAPILYINRGELSTTLTNSYLADDKARQALISDAVSQCMDIELAHLLSTGDAIRCPLALAFRKCSKAEEGGCDGLVSHPDDIPTEPCMLRSLLVL